MTERTQRNTPGRFWMRVTRSVGLVLGAAYLLMCAGAFFFQRALIYPRPAPVAISAEGGELIRITAGAAEVVAWHVPAAEGQPTVVHFHGNGEQLSDMTSVGERFAAYGLGFLAVEYPGYGTAAGEPSENALYAAAEAALVNALRPLGLPSSRLILQGRSLGTGVAVEMALRGYGTGLILLSPYTSMTEMAALALPMLPTGLLLRDRYLSADKAPSVGLPSLVLHGEEDRLIPVAMGERLCRLLPRCEFVPLEGEGHGFALATPERMERISDFVRRAVEVAGPR